jgi:hypothetical protein
LLKEELFIASTSCGSDAGVEPAGCRKDEEEDITSELAETMVVHRVEVVDFPNSARGPTTAAIPSKSSCTLRWISEAAAGIASLLGTIEHRERRSASGNKTLCS